MKGQLFSCLVGALPAFALARSTGASKAAKLLKFAIPGLPHDLQYHRG